MSKPSHRTASCVRRSIRLLLVPAQPQSCIGLLLCSVQRKHATKRHRQPFQHHQSYTGSHPRQSSITPRNRNRSVIDSRGYGRSRHRRSKHNLSSDEAHPRPPPLSKAAVNNNCKKTRKQYCCCRRAPKSNIVEPISTATAAAELPLFDRGAERRK